MDLCLEAVQDRIGIGEVRTRGAVPLPGQGPATGLLADVIGGRADDQDPGSGRQGQDAILILQQDQRFAHRLTGDRPMRRCSEQGELASELALGRLRLFKQVHAELHPQDAADRVVQPCHRDRAGPHVRQGAFVQPLPAVRRHCHVQPGSEGCRTVGIGAAADLAVAIPVADDEAPEVHPLLQYIGQQCAVPMQLLAMETVV